MILRNFVTTRTQCTRFKTIKHVFLELPYMNNNKHVCYNERKYLKLNG